MLPDLPVGAWIVLGFLLDGAGPRSGYDLQSQAARSVAHFWPITKAHVYSALPRLEAAGLVEGTAVAQQGLPDKRLFTGTQAGEQAFARWVATGNLGTGSLRSPMLVKTFFGGVLQPADMRAMLDRHEAACLVRLERFRQLEQRAQFQNNHAARLRGLTIRHGILTLEAELTWIAEARLAFASDRRSAAIGHGDPAGEPDKLR